MTDDSRWRPQEGCRCISFRTLANPDHKCPPDTLLHLDGIPWHDADPHPLWRRCRPQTIGFGIERCSCGAIRHMGMRGWMERNYLKRAIESTAKRLRKASR